MISKQPEQLSKNRSDNSDKPVSQSLGIILVMELSAVTGSLNNLLIKSIKAQMLCNVFARELNNFAGEGNNGKCCFTGKLEL